MRRLDPNQRLAGLAAVVLPASMLLPWWQDPFLRVSQAGVGQLTFLEVALASVAAAVLVLLFGRAEGRAFHLPLSDGTLLAASGIWASFLVLFRMLDPPERSGRTGSSVIVTTDYGLRWGIALALAAAILLAVAGVRARRKHRRGEPESVAADADAAPTEELRG